MAKILDAINLAYYHKWPKPVYCSKQQRSDTNIFAQDISSGEMYEVTKKVKKGQVVRLYADSRSDSLCIYLIYLFLENMIIMVYRTLHCYDIILITTTIYPLHPNTHP